MAACSLTVIDTVLFFIAFSLRVIDSMIQVAAGRNLTRYFDFVFALRHGWGESTFQFFQLRQLLVVLRGLFQPAELFVMFHQPLGWGLLETAGISYITWSIVLGPQIRDNTSRLAIRRFGFVKPKSGSVVPCRLQVFIGSIPDRTRLARRRRNSRWRCCRHLEQWPGGGCRGSKPANKSRRTLPATD